MWAIRLMHESQYHLVSMFVTLTYNDEHLPSDNGLQLAHWKNFAKKFRRDVGPFRFYTCGDYGEDQLTGAFLRPHYHTIIFGHNFHQDRIPWQKSKYGDQLWTSEILNNVWGKGFAVIGDLTFQSAGYVARYILKKRNGKQKDMYGGRSPHFSTMSLKPGIGATWFSDYAEETYRDDNVVLRGRRYKPPKYYDALLKAVDGQLHDEIKDNRIQAAQERADDYTKERLAIRQRCAKAKARNQQRNL